MHRRHASRRGRTGGLLDAEVLDVLARDVGPDAARAFDALLQAEYRSEVAHRACLPLEALELEHRHGARATRSTIGCGGGRRRPNYPVDQDGGLDRARD